MTNKTDTTPAVKVDARVRTPAELIREYRALADFHEKHNMPILPHALREILDDFEEAFKQEMVNRQKEGAENATAAKGRYGVSFDDGTEWRFRTSFSYRKWLHDCIDNSPDDECGWAREALNNLDRGIQFTEIR